MKPLILNKAQRHLHNIIKKLWEENKIIRIFLLKARQMGMCLDPSTRVLTSDLRWVPIDSIRPGDEIVSVDEMSPGGRGQQRKMRKAIVQARNEVFETAIKLTMEDGRTIVATGDHRFLMLQRGGTLTRWRKVKDIQVGDSIRYITDTWGNPNYEDGWIGGMLDGEGSLALSTRPGGNIGIAQVKGDVFDRVIKYFRENDYSFRVEWDKRKAGSSSKFGNKDVGKVVLSKMNEIFRLIGKTRPSRFINRDWWIAKELPGKKSGEAWRRIVGIEVLDKRKMVDLQTSTKTFIAEGFVSHNSTYVEALIYSLTSQLENQNATIIADSLNGSNYIFEMSKLYHEKIADHLRTPIKKSNEKKLEFEGTHSQIIIDTAENKEAGRKFTYRICHLSEYAFFRNPNEMMVGLSQAVPSKPRTIVIKETTANGFNFARDEWERLENGESDEIPVFMPWYWGEEYQMEGDIVIGDHELGVISWDETALSQRMEREGIDNIEQRLVWRRWCIRNNCGNGSDKDRVASFKQEYPSTPQEAFKASGDPFFDKDEVTRQFESVKPPLFRADIVKEGHKWVLRKSPEGIFQFYEDRCDMEYVLGGDASSGSGTDYSCLVVRRKDTNKISAFYHGKVDTDELEELSFKLGNYFNEALIAIENDKFGFAVNQKLKQRYGNLYYQEVINKKTKARRKEFGWNTTAVTRPAMLAQMQEEIREGALQLENKILMKECLTFIRNPDSGKVEAQEGCNDDTIIACAISGMVRALRPYKLKVKNKGRHNTQQPKNAGFSF